MSPTKKSAGLTYSGDIHGKALTNKLKLTKDEDLKQAYQYYREYREKIDSLKIVDEAAIRRLIKATNIYREQVNYIFENRPNSGQEGLRPTILEEFLFFLIKGVVLEKLGDSCRSLVIGKGNIYVSLSFTPRSFVKLFKQPYPYIHTKDQDFVLGCYVKLRVTPLDGDQNADESEFVIPVLAFECKTYLERNMLDSCAATARRLKGGIPYCIYMVVSEYLKMDEASPELTDIDEVFILCKAMNSEREKFKRENLPPHQLDENLIIDLYNRVHSHLNRLWWEPEEALKRGKIIGRP